MWATLKPPAPYRGAWLIWRIASTASSPNTSTRNTTSFAHGISKPNLTWPDSSSGMPPMTKGAPAWVCISASIAASLAGWYFATIRPLKSPLIG